MNVNHKKKQRPHNPVKVNKNKIRLGKSIHMENVYCHSEDVVVRKIEGELILVPLVAGIGSLENEIYALDESGKEIWARIDGQKTIAEIIVDLKKIYGSSSRSIGADVAGLMTELAKRGLIVNLSV